MSTTRRPLPDPRQPERTALAWRRTTLASLGCGALLVAGPETGVFGVAAAVVLVGVVAGVAQLRGAPLRRGATTAPGATMLVAVALAVVVAATAAAVAALR